MIGDTTRDEFLSYHAALVADLADVGKTRSALARSGMSVAEFRETAALFDQLAATVRRTALEIDVEDAGGDAEDCRAMARDNGYDVRLQRDPYGVALVEPSCLAVYRDDRVVLGGLDRNDRRGAWALAAAVARQKGAP